MKCSRLLIAFYSFPSFFRPLSPSHSHTLTLSHSAFPSNHLVVPPPLTFLLSLSLSLCLSDCLSFHLPSLAFPLPMASFGGPISRDGTGTVRRRGNLLSTLSSCFLLPSGHLSPTFSLTLTRRSHLRNLSEHTRKTGLWTALGCRRQGQQWFHHRQRCCPFLCQEWPPPSDPKPGNYLPFVI